MSGLISGALKGLGEGMAFVGKTNFAAKLEAEKAAAEEAKQMRLIEMQQQYATQNRAADQEFQLGNTVLQSQLRGEQLDKEINARSALTDKEIQARSALTDKEIEGRIRAAQIGNAPRAMSETDQRIFDLTKQRDAAIRSGNAEERKKLNDMLGLKDNDVGKYEIKERKDVTGATLGYDLVSPNGYQAIPMFGASTVPAQSTNPQSKVPWANTYAK